MPGVTTTSGSSRRSRRPRVTWATVVVGGGGHDRAEVAGGLAVDEVAHPVGDVRLDQRDVAAGSGTPARTCGRRSRGSPCPRRAEVPDAGRAEEGADAGAGGPHPLGEVALRHHLELDLPGAVEAVEDPGVRLPREGADHLAHPARRPAARRVPCRRCPALFDTTVRSPAPCRISASMSSTGMPGHAEAADQHGRAVGDAGDRLVRVGAADPAVTTGLRRRSRAPRPAPARRRCRSRPRPSARRSRPAAARGCRGSGRRTRRAGARWRSRRPWR